MKDTRSRYDCSMTSPLVDHYITLTATYNDYIVSLNNVQEKNLSLIFPELDDDNNEISLDVVEKSSAYDVLRKSTGSQKCAAVESLALSSKIAESVLGETSSNPEIAELLSNSAGSLRDLLHSLSSAAIPLTACISPPSKATLPQNSVPIEHPLFESIPSLSFSSPSFDVNNIQGAQIIPNNTGDVANSTSVTPCDVSFSSAFSQRHAHFESTTSHSSFSHKTSSSSLVVEPGSFCDVVHSPGRASKLFMQALTPPVNISSFSAFVDNGGVMQAQKKILPDDRRVFKYLNNKLSVKEGNSSLKSIRWTPGNYESAQTTTAPQRDFLQQKKNILSADYVESQEQDLLRKCRLAEFHKSQVMLKGDLQRFLTENKASKEATSARLLRHLLTKLVALKRVFISNEGEIDIIFALREALDLIDQHITEVPGRIRVMLLEFCSKHKPQLRSMIREYRVMNKAMLQEAELRGELREIRLLTLPEELEEQQRRRGFCDQRQRRTIKSRLGLTGRGASRMQEKRQLIYRKAAEEVALQKEAEGGGDDSGKAHWKLQKNIEREHFAKIAREGFQQDLMDENDESINDTSDLELEKETKNLKEEDIQDDLNSDTLNYKQKEAELLKEDALVEKLAALLADLR